VFKGRDMIICYHYGLELFLNSPLPDVTVTLGDINNNQICTHAY